LNFTFLFNFHYLFLYSFSLLLEMLLLCTVGAFAKQALKATQATPIHKAFLVKLR
jgi:hypothetical protein